MQYTSISLLLSGVNPNLMFRIFKKKSKKPGELQDVQLRPVEQSGVDPLEKLLGDSRNTIGKRLKALVSGHSDINEDLLDELETALLTADVGVKASLGIMENLRTAINNGSIREPGALLPAVQAELYELIEPCEQFLAVDTSHKPFVILMVGINGAGKTTTIGKLAQRFKEEGLSVMLAAGDTFRAAAVEQLKSWGARNDVPVIAQGTGADSAAVIFDALESAKARDIDILIADTAGRLHTQSNLMEELKKIRRVIGRVDENAPHEVMLVVDAGTGTNALNQAQPFQRCGQCQWHHHHQAGWYCPRRYVICHCQRVGLSRSVISVSVRRQRICDPLMRVLSSTPFCHWTSWPISQISCLIGGTCTAVKTCRGSTPALSIVFGSRKSCCSRPRSKPLFPISTGLSSGFRILKAWLRHQLMRCWRSGQDLVITHVPVTC